MADHISDRRDKANSFFLAVNTALLTAMGLILSNKGGGLLAAAPAAPALILCIFWMKLINSYRQLNSVKFQVIGKLEQALPSAPYAYEWELLGRGEDPNKYRPLTHLEQYIPLTFAALYIALIGVAAFMPLDAKEPTQVEVSGRFGYARRSTSPPASVPPPAQPPPSPIPTSPPATQNSGKADSDSPSSK